MGSVADSPPPLLPPPQDIANKMTAEKPARRNTERLDLTIMIPLCQSYQTEEEDHIPDFACSGAPPQT
jgi:hypothetical protein